MSMTGEDIGAEVDDLAAELGAVLDAEKPQEQEAASANETPEQEQERLYRREGRRFVAKEEEKAGTPEQAKVDPPAKPAWRPTWYKDEYGPWDKLGEPFRNALREQERNAAQAIERHSTAAKTWEPISKALEPFAQELAAAGSSPQRYVGQLIETAKFLQNEPVKAIEWLCKQYLQCDVIALADWMYQNGQQPQQVDPRDQKIQALEQRINQFETAGQRQQQEVVNRQIADFARDKPDFAAVRPIMAALAKQNPEASLDDLYQQARWAHPEARESILKEQEDKRLADLRGKRAAGATSPRGAPTNGAARSRPTMSLEDEIAMHLDGGV